MTTIIMMIRAMITAPITTATDPIITAPSSGLDSIGGIPTSTGIHSAIMDSIAITMDTIPAIIITEVTLIMTIITDTAEHPPPKAC